MMGEKNGPRVEAWGFPWGWDLLVPEPNRGQDGGFDYAWGWNPRVGVVVGGGVPILALDEKVRKPVDDNTGFRFGRR